MTKIAFSFLFPSKNLAQALEKLNGISRSQMLKRDLSKKDLNAPVLERQEFCLPIDIINFGKINPEYSGEPVLIIKETKDVVALMKPCRVHCHPLRYDETDNILSALREMGRSDLLGVNVKAYDRGLLYRLDYETSGLVLMAKSEPVFKYVRSNFHEIAHKKTYLAEVQGNLDSQTLLENKLASAGERGARMKESQSGRLAEIVVTPVMKKTASTIVKVELRQGLRHQIRVQLSLAGFPILGDPLYGKASNGSLHLHCWRYEIDSIGSFQADYPPWYTP